MSLQKWAFINNKFILENIAGLHVCDLAIQRGYGVFDFFKIKNNQPVFLNEHLDRFFYSARQMHLQVHKTRQEIEHIILDLVSKNKMPDSGIRLTLTGGYSTDGFQLAQPNFIITQQALPTISNEQRQKGIKLVSYPHQRQLPYIKTIDYLMAIWLQPYIKQQNADEVLYYQGKSISECPRSNIFMVTHSNTIVTPSHHILKGITRKKLLTLAAHTFQTEERDISLEELKTAKEVFITSTTKTILPVTAIDDHKIGAGNMGTITTQLLQQWQSLT